MSELVPMMDARKAWLEQRKAGIGGSEIAAIVGMSPWASAIDVYLSKLGLSEPQDVTDQMAWGTFMEKGIREAYERRTGWKVQYPGLEATQHPSVPLVGTPDGLVPDGNRGFEAKNIAFKGPEWGKEGSDEIPIHYVLQAVVYMAIFDQPQWDVVPLFSGSRLEIFTVYRNREIEEQILQAARWFWEQHVTPHVPPPIDASESYTRFLAKKYALGNQTYIEATPEAEQIAADLRGDQDAMNLLKVQERWSKNNLADFIGENKGCHFPDGSRAQWIRPKPQQVTDWEGIVRHKGIDAEVIAEFTEEKPSTPYIRLYEAPKGRKALKP